MLKYFTVCVSDFIEKCGICFALFADFGNKLPSLCIYFYFNLKESESLLRSILNFSRNVLECGNLGFLKNINFLIGNMAVNVARQPRYINGTINKWAVFFSQN